MARTFDFQPNDLGVRNVAEIANFDGPITNDDYAELIGDITGNAAITVYYNAPRGDAVCPITIRAKAQGVYSSVVRIYTNPKCFEYSDCTVENKGQGTGPQILKRVAETAKRLGFTFIKAEGRKHVSAQHPHLDCYGHYVYVKIGFDAAIPPGTPARPEHLAHHVRLLDLTATDDGLLWWKGHGVTVPHMVFDLADNSPSWQRLEAAAAAAPPPAPAAGAAPAAQAVPAPAPPAPAQAQPAANANANAEAATPNAAP